MTATADSMACTRNCRYCGVDKAFNDFPQTHGEPKGRKCKACVNNRQNVRRDERLGIEGKRDLVARNAELRPGGHQECKTCGQVKSLDLYRKKAGRITRACLDCLNAKQRDAYASNENGLRDRLKEHQKRQQRKNAGKVSQARRDYVARNRVKITNRQNEWSKKRVRTDSMFALKKRIRSLISNAFASVGSAKNAETQAILGCTFEDFKLHLERQFLMGMSWDRMGREIHIDHIVPLATATCAQDVIALNHFTNLRPLWAQENISKGAKVLALL